MENADEKQFCAIVQNSADAVISINSEGNIVFWNNAAEKFFGYPADEAIGKPLTIIMPERFHKAYRDGMQRVLLTGESSILGKTVEKTGIRRDGSEFPIELTLSRWETEKGVFLQEFFAILLCAKSSRVN
jgi:PAS domain S-box-containing protein